VFTLTPSQTIGPFFAVMLPLGSNELVAPGTPGSIVIEGAVFDGAGAPVSDALIEIWQADRRGRYAHPGDPRFADVADPPGFGGWGRCPTSADGTFRFVTVMPGAVVGVDERPQAPHVSVSLFARGLLRRLSTRIYFPTETHANALDPVLSSIADSAVRATLVAAEAGPARFRFDIRLRGENETAFFAV
jgi:protocatechuate 3,4-dioxygenase alpha subunit